MPEPGNTEQSVVETTPLQTEALIKWMGLENVPDAKTLDPDNKIGLQSAYLLTDGCYRDPIPPSVIEAAQQELAGKGSFGEYIPPIDISLLKDQYIPQIENALRIHLSGITGQPTTTKTEHITNQHIPLFKEQVGAVAQYLSNLGIELPATAGKDFILLQTEETTRLKTKNPNLTALFVRNADLSQVTEVNLLVSPTKK